MSDQRLENHLVKTMDAAQHRSTGRRDGPIAVKTLLGSSQVETALKCVGSFLWACQEDVRLYIHDDGTLTEKDTDTLRDSFPSAKVVSKLEADNAVFPRLAGYLACAEYRRRHPLAMKLFDICMLQEESERFLFCDSDVFFFKRFSLPVSEIGADAVFMRDTQQAYALYPWHVKPLGVHSVGNRVNTGFMLLTPGALQLDVVERYLSDRGVGAALRRKAQWIEQTCWSILSQTCNSHQWDERQLFLASHRNLPVTADTVGIHFVSTFRGQLSSYTNSNMRTECEAAELGTAPLVAANSAVLFWGETQSRLARLGRNLGQWPTKQEPRIAVEKWRSCYPENQGSAGRGATLATNIGASLQVTSGACNDVGLTRPLSSMQFISFFSAGDLATCVLSFISAREALGVDRILAVEDGTVSREQVEDLRRKTGDWLEVVPAQVAYDALRTRITLPDKIDQLLKSRRVLQKLFQVHAVAEGAYFYFDSDVVFRCKVDRQALESDLQSCDTLISANPHFCAYSYGFRDIGRIRHSFYRLNSGVFVQREGLPVCESAVALLGAAGNEYLGRTWVEQSTRAQIYNNYRCRVFSEDSVGEPSSSGDAGKQPHLVHFMGASRTMMTAWSVDEVLTNIRQSPVQRLKTGPARRNGILLYYADRVRRHMFNKYQMTLPASPVSMFEA